MNPIWLGTMIANVLNSNRVQPGRVAIPRGRRHVRSSVGSMRSARGTIRRILKRVSRRLSIRRAVAKSTSLRCPRCNTTSLTPQKTHFIAHECRRCRGIWLDQEDLEELIARASHKPNIPCLSRVQSWEDVFRSALFCSPHRGAAEASAPCGDNGSQEDAPAIPKEEDDA